MKFLVNGFFILIILNSINGQPHKQKIDSLNQVLEHNMGGLNQAKTLLELGFLLQDSLTNTAKKYTDKALNIALELNDYKLLRSVYNQLGNINRKQGNYIGAVDNYQKALVLAERLDDQVRIAGTLHNLSTAENDLGNLNDAKKYLNQAIHLYSKIGVDSDEMKIKMARSYNSLGIAYKNSGQYDSAFTIYRAGIKLLRNLEDKSEHPFLYNSIGFLHDIVNNEDSARYYFEKAYALNVRLGKTLNRIYSTMHLSRLARRNGDFQESLKYVKEGLELADKGGFKYVQGTMYLHLSNTYKGMGLMDSAIWSYEQFVPLNDSIVNADYNKQLAALRVDFDTEKKEQQIANLELEKQNEVIKRNAYLVGLIGLGCLSAFIVSWFRYRIRKNRQLKEKEIEQFKSQLTIYTDRLLEKSTRIEELNLELEKVKDEISNGCPAYNGVLDNLMQSTILTYDEWTEFKKLFSQVHPGFLTNLRENFPELTDTEERLLALTKLNLQTKEVASMLGISVESVNKSRYRLRKKLNIESGAIESIVARL